MYKVIFIALLMVSINANAVDFKKANPILQSLANEITKTENLVTDFFPEFDESYSDLSKGKLKYDAEATLTDPPWKSSHTAKITASTSYVLHSGVTKSAIEVKFSAKVETDMLAFAQHAGGIALKVDAQNFYASKTETKKSKSLLDRLAKVSTFEDLSDLVIEGQERAIELLDLELAMTFPPTYLAAVKTQKKAYEDMLVNEKKTSGVTTELVLYSSDATGFISKYTQIKSGDYFPGSSTLTLNQDSIELETSVIINTTTKKANAMKKRLEDALDGINKGSSTEEDNVRDAYKRALKEFKKVIIDEHPFVN